VPKQRCHIDGKVRTEFARDSSDQGSWLNGGVISTVKSAQILSGGPFDGKVRTLDDE
jgi:hypothetical protein